VARHYARDVLASFDVATSLGALGVAINAVLLVFVWLQLRAAAKATRRDHDRRRRQATIEWFAATLDRRSEFGERLPPDRDPEAIGRHLKKVKGRADPDIIGYLNVYEMLATAVNMGIHDLEVIHRISGRRVIVMYEAYLPWIEHRRLVMGSRVYDELETLVVSLIDRREQVPSTARARRLRGRSRAS
jgi:hypothetical protein